MRYLETIGILLLLSLCMPSVAQTADSLQLKQLQEEMYRHYSQRNTAEFQQTVEQLKVLALKLGEEKVYYKAYGNQAIYASSYINRGEAVERAKELYRQAEQAHSMYGLYTANYVLGTIYTGLTLLDEAKSHYHDALQILNEHFPQENRAALYLAMAKIERAEKHYDKVDEYVERVLADSSSMMQHRLSAMSYRCLSLADREAPVAERDKAYAEREMLKKKYGHDDNFGYIIDFDQAMLHSDFDRCKAIVDKLPQSPLHTKMLYYSKLYYGMKDYKQAYHYYVRYKDLSDSLNNDNVRKNTFDMGMMLDKARAENEVRENQARLHRLKWIAAGLLAFVGFVFLAIYAYIRYLQLKRLKKAYDKLEEATAAKERIESELRIARSIQMAMVPHEFPESSQLDIYASMIPAKEVGGDLYDFAVMDGKLYFCLGDVSGKGVPAALFMAMSIRLFRTLCKYRLTPAEIAGAMNAELVQNNENGMFVTMFIGLLDLNSGHLDFCNAGHNPPILDGHFIEMEPNAPVGLWEGLEYVGQSMADVRGKQLFVYSDGLNEAENHVQDQYSDDRLLEFLKRHSDMAARRLVDELIDDVASHVDGAAPSDDLTMLCLRLIHHMG